MALIIRPCFDRAALFGPCSQSFTVLPSSVVLYDLYVVPQRERAEGVGNGRFDPVTIERVSTENNAVYQ
jgi:hypothetical protein